MNAITSEEVSLEALDALWPALETQAQAGRLSESAMNHLLSLADDLSAQDDWSRAWRALAITEQAVQQAGDAYYLAEAATHRGILQHRPGNLR